MHRRQRMSYPFATATATILRAIKAGKVSGTNDGSGQIEIAELHGIYPRNGADTDAAVELGACLRNMSEH